MRTAKCPLESSNCDRPLAEQQYLFSEAPDLPSLRFLPTKQRLVWVVSQGVGFNSGQILVCDSHKLCVTVVVAYLVGRNMQSLF